MIASNRRKTAPIGLYMARILCRITTGSRSRRALPGSFIASAGGMIHIAHADRCICGLGFYDHAYRSNAKACQKTATLVLCALEHVRILSSTNRRRKITHGYTLWWMRRSRKSSSDGPLCLLVAASEQQYLLYEDAFHIQSVAWCGKRHSIFLHTPDYGLLFFRGKANCSWTLLFLSWSLLVTVRLLDWYLRGTFASTQKMADARPHNANHLKGYCWTVTH